MEKLEIRGSELLINCDLLPYIARDFEAKCKALLALDSPEITLDLSGVREIGSMFVAALVQTCVAATSSGKKVTLRVPAKLQSYFDFADADPYITVETV